MQSWIFSGHSSTFQCALDPLEIIRRCWFDSQVTFIIFKTVCIYKTVNPKSICMCFNKGKRQQSFSEYWRQVSCQEIKITMVIAQQTSIPAERGVGAEGGAVHAVAAGATEGAGVVVELGVVERVGLAAKHAVAVEVKAAQGPKAVRGVVAAVTGRAEHTVRVSHAWAPARQNRLLEEPLKAITALAVPAAESASAVVPCLIYFMD